MSCPGPGVSKALRRRTYHEPSPQYKTFDGLFRTLSPFLTLFPQPKELFLMSSTRQVTSSTDNVKLIIDALADYAKETGIDLSKNPFAAKFEQSRSPNAILQLLEEREKAFKEYRNGNRRLLNCLNPAVTVLHRFLGILSRAAGLVSRSYHLVGLLTRPRQIPFPPASVLFVGIDTLLEVRPSDIFFSFKASL